MILEGKIFTHISEIRAQIREFDSCKFEGIDLSVQDFTGLVFSDCEFSGCDLSNVDVTKAAFRGVVFRGCRLMGVDFSRCNTLGMDFSAEETDFSYAIFIGLTLRKVKFLRSRFVECIFQQCDFQEASFQESDCSGARFDSCDLRKTDFRGATNIRLSPLSNQLKRAAFSSDSLAGLLDDFEIIVD